MTDFERTFLPFVEKKGVELAPTNRFLAIKKRRLAKAQASGPSSHASTSTAEHTDVHLDLDPSSPAGPSLKPRCLARASQLTHTLACRSPPLVHQEHPRLESPCSSQVRLFINQVWPDLQVCAGCDRCRSGRRDLGQRRPSPDHRYPQGRPLVQEEAPPVQRGHPTSLLWCVEEAARLQRANRWVTDPRLDLPFLFGCRHVDSIEHDRRTSDSVRAGPLVLRLRVRLWLRLGRGRRRGRGSRQRQRRIAKEEARKGLGSQRRGHRRSWRRHVRHRRGGRVL